MCGQDSPKIITDQVSQGYMPHFVNLWYSWSEPWVWLGLMGKLWYVWKKAGCKTNLQKRFLNLARLTSTVSTESDCKSSGCEFELQPSHTVDHEMSRLMTNPTKWYVRPAKTQISLGIRPVLSESSLSTWRKLGSLTTHWTHSKNSDQSGQMPRQIWVFAGYTVILLVLSWGFYDHSSPSINSRRADVRQWRKYVPLVLI